MPPLLHIVCLRFRDDLSEAYIREHFEKEVALSRRMPELVESWVWGPNTSLASRADVNGGCQWVVVARLRRSEDLQAYLDHPQHGEVGAIQGPLLVSKFVVDVEASDAMRVA
jgi:hypothetical protein